MVIKACSLDKNYTSYMEVKKRGVVAQGWRHSGDLSFFREEKDINKFLNLVKTPEKEDNKKKNAFNELFNLKEGDIILAWEGKKIKGICEIPKEFEYVYQPDYEYANAIFPVKWVDWENIAEEDPPHGYRPRNPIFIVDRSDIHDFVEKYWERYKQQNNLQIQPDEYNEQLKQIKEQLPEKIKQSKEKYYKL